MRQLRLEHRMETGEPFFFFFKLAYKVACFLLVHFHTLFFSLLCNPSCQSPCPTLHVSAQNALSPCHLGSVTLPSLSLRSFSLLCSSFQFYDLSQNQLLHQYTYVTTRSQSLPRRTEVQSLESETPHLVIISRSHPFSCKIPHFLFLYG